MAPEDNSERSLSSDAFFFVDCTFEVPVFDARDREVVIPKGIRDIPITFPPFNGAIPEHSVALIAYSVCSYKRSQEDQYDNVVFNAVWAAILECPDQT